MLKCYTTAVLGRSKSRISLLNNSINQKLEKRKPPNPDYFQKLGLMETSLSKDTAMHAFDRQTDAQTDGRTAFS